MAFTNDIKSIPISLPLVVFHLLLNHLHLHNHCMNHNHNHNRYHRNHHNRHAHVCVIIIFIKLFRIVLILKLFLLDRILLAGVVKAFTSSNTFILNFKTVSLDSIMVSEVVVLVINFMKVSLLSIVQIGVKLGGIVINFWLDYLMLGVLIFGVVLLDVGVVLLVIILVNNPFFLLLNLVILMIVAGEMLEVEIT